MEAIMKAVSYKGTHKVAVSDHPKPKLNSPTDAILKVTTSGICGSDLHMYDGRTELKEGTVVGHEIMGVIEQVGEAVRSIKKGDRVVLPFNIAYGYAGMGPYQGGQAEFVLVPYADFNCLKLPGTPGDEWEDDFLLLADVFPTGYHATELASVSPGKTVAVFGAGPVGLLAAYSSVLKGASEVYVIDNIAERLEKAKELGAVPIDFTHGDPVERIFEIRKKHQPTQQSHRPGEDKIQGVDCAIDAVGYQARDDIDPSQENPTQALENCLRVVNPTGSVGVIGVYIAPDPRARDDQKKQGIFSFPLADFFSKGLTVGTGQAPVKKYNEYLRDLIISGRARPSLIVSHHIKIDQAPEAYSKFDQRTDGYTKVLIRFGE